MVDLGTNQSQELLNGSSAKFQGLVELSKESINFAFIWRSLKGCCHGNQLKSQNRHFSRKNFLCRAAIPKRIRISERRGAA